MLVQLAVSEWGANDLLGAARPSTHARKACIVYDHPSRVGRDNPTDMSGRVAPGKRAAHNVWESLESR